VQHHAVESGHHRRRLFERNPLSAWQKPFRKSRKLSGTGWIIAEELWSEMRRSVLHSWAKKNLLIAAILATKTSSAAGIVFVDGCGANVPSDCSS
jgi:hypothetical protein